MPSACGLACEVCGLREKDFKGIMANTGHLPERNQGNFGG